MTKSKGVGRGGARPNSGPKKKPPAGPTQVAGAANAVPIIPVGLTDEQLRKFCEALAFETLVNIATNGAAESARVAASRELLDRSLGKPKPAAPPKSPDQPTLDDWGDLLNARQPTTSERAN